MSIRHLAAVVKKEISHIIRDPYTLFLVLLSPTVLMVLMALPGYWAVLMPAV